MGYAHHEYLFDQRHRDLETGKLDIDKIATINSFQSYADLVTSGKETSSEYLESVRYTYEQGIIARQEHEMQNVEHQKLRIEQEKISTTLRELRERREQLNAREEEIERNRRIRENGQYILYGDKRIRTG